MSNQGNSQLPKMPSAGDQISASEQRKIMNLLITRLSVGEGLSMRSFSGRLIISLSPERRLGGLRKQHFQIQTVAEDHLVCRAWNNGQVESADVTVAKEWMLRKTPFHSQTRNGITYTYTGSDGQTRTASNGTDDDITEKITPSFQPGDIIVAERGIKGGTGVEAAPDWEMSHDGRKWGKVDA